MDQAEHTIDRASALLRIERSGRERTTYVAAKAEVSVEHLNVRINFSCADLGIAGVSVRGVGRDVALLARSQTIAR